MLGTLDAGAADVTWVPHGDREAAFARLLGVLEQHRLDYDLYGGFGLYQHGVRYAVVFEMY